jgi:hypothetical protein
LAAVQNHAEALYKLGVKDEKGGRREEAIKWYRSAAKQGHTGAQYYLGAMYEKRWREGGGRGGGEGGGADYKHKAFKWYVRADIQGHPQVGSSLKKLSREEEEGRIEGDGSKGEGGGRGGGGGGGGGGEEEREEGFSIKDLPPIPGHGVVIKNIRKSKIRAWVTSNDLFSGRTDWYRIKYGEHQYWDRNSQNEVSRGERREERGERGEERGERREERGERRSQTLPDSHKVTIEVAYTSYTRKVITSSGVAFLVTEKSIFIFRNPGYLEAEIPL